LFFFFFSSRRRHTRFSRDWSSDVCSSDLITIARVAEASVSSGFEDFVRFLAYLSVSLGVLNLLPVPVLDGGHIVYYTIEAIRRKPLSERVQEFGLRIGMALI